nr:crossover junction endodeoxyribonuclease RuvC [uncultured Fusobacterium sp.]
MRVIGIDPGTAIVGFGIIDYEKNKYNCVDYGVILTDKDLNVEDRLEIVYDELTKILKKYSPEYIAVEDLFYFKNNKTVISVAQARGIILLAAKQNKIPINSYTPLQVKMGITGYGKAEKKQVQLMVQKFLNLKEIPKPDDAADALAICITHINSLTSKLSSMNVTNLKNIKIDGKTNTISLADYKELLKK